MSKSSITAKTYKYNLNISHVFQGKLHVIKRLQECYKLKYAVKPLTTHEHLLALDVPVKQ